MPSYDYRCRTCDTTTEVTRSVTAAQTPVACVDCGGATSRVWSAVSVGAGAPAPAPSGGGCCGGGCCG